MAETTSAGAPVVLLATDDEVWADSVERFLAPQGYRVVRTASAAGVLEASRRVYPDVILLEQVLSDMPAADASRELRNRPWITPGTPILVSSKGELSAVERIRLLDAGVWEILSSPTHPDELAARLRNYVAAKRYTDQARFLGLIDPETGLYNERGLMRRCEELTAEAFRRHAALACLAVAPDLGGREDLTVEETEAVVSRIMRVLQQATRRSDVPGRHGPVEFVVIAPRTDPGGAQGLAKRLSRAADQPGRSGSALRIKVGYDAVPNMREMPTEAGQMIGAAIEALHRTTGRSGAQVIQPFRPFEHRRPN